MAWNTPADATTADFEAALNNPNGQAPQVAAVRGPKKLGYVRIPGVVDTSFSRLNLLHACPRKFYLADIRGARSFSPTAHTAFGHAFAAGIQEYLRVFDELGHERAKAVASTACLAHWDCYNLYEEDKRRIKTYWLAVDAVENWCENSARYITDRYRIATVLGKPGVELFFYVAIGDSYAYQGHIDLVLEDRVTGELTVLEIKTGSAAAQRADWGNSSQTIGYHILLQAMGAYAETPIAYHVLYLYYDAYGREVSYMPFSRSLAERSEWITSLMQDISMLEMYKTSNVWPKRGSSCREWGRDCEFYGLCDLTHAAAADNGTFEFMTLDEVDFYCTVQDLLEMQRTELEKSGGLEACPL